MPITEKIFREVVVVPGDWVEKVSKGLRPLRLSCQTQGMYV